MTRRRRRRAGTAPGADRVRNGHLHAVGVRDAPGARERSICAEARGASSGTDRRLQTVPVTGTVPARRVLTQSSILHHRRRISSHHVHQKDSSTIPRAMKRAMK